MKRALGFALLALVADLAYTAILVGAMKTTGWAPSTHTAATAGWYDHMSTLDILKDLLAAAGLEEAIFRAIPLGLASLFRAPPVVVLGIVVVSSVLFGLVHGGPDGVLVQGVGGLIYSWAYFQCGGRDGHPFRGWQCCTLAHFLHNLTLLAVIGLV